MLRLVHLAVLAVMLAVTGPALAQGAGDPPNRLSLEALTAPQPGDTGGSYRRPSRRAGATRYRASNRYYAPRSRAGYRRPAVHRSRGTYHRRPSYRTRR